MWNKSAFKFIRWLKFYTYSFVYLKMPKFLMLAERDRMDEELIIA